MARVAKSSWYFKAKDSREDRRHKNQGRPILGYTVNRDGTIVFDRTIALLLRQYRARLEYANGGGYRKLTKLLRRDHGIYVNKKKIYRICKEEGILLEKRSKRTVLSKSTRFIAQNRVVTRPNQAWQFDIKYGYIDGETGCFYGAKRT
ncbi:MAG: IS3 family transposase [Candidatus Pacearchaeota archaeon]|jgi:putative transposase